MAAIATAVVATAASEELAHARWHNKELHVLASRQAKFIGSAAPYSASPLAICSQRPQEAVSTRSLDEILSEIEQLKLLVREQAKLVRKTKGRLGQRPKRHA